jgi:hypothetical protein
MLIDQKDSEMSEQSIRKILSHAYNKAGKILGREFSVYRPVVLNDSLSDANFIFKRKAAFTINKNFINPQTEGFKQYIGFTQDLDLLPGDIFNDSDETFVIVWNRGIEDLVAIRASDIVEIHRGTWATTNGLQPVRERIAKNVPASVTRSQSISDIRIGTVANTAQAARYEVRIYSQTAEIQQTDNVIFPDGTILHIDEINHTEFCQLLTCSVVG